MAVLTIGQMAISRLESNGNFPCSSGRKDCVRTLQLSFHGGWERKRKYFRITNSTSADGRLGSRQVLAKEFEFEPSFDEYLKALETVKSVRDKMQENQFDREECSDEWKGRRNASLRQQDMRKRNYRRDNPEGEQDRVYHGKSVGTNASRRNEHTYKYSEYELNRAKSTAKNEGSEKTQMKKTKFERGATNKQRFNHVVKSEDTTLDTSRNVDASGATRAKSVKIATRSSVVDGRSGNVAVRNESEYDWSSRELGQIEYQKSPPIEKMKRSEMLWKRKRDSPIDVMVQEDERAAFRSFEDLDGIIGKPQVSKRMMEERIQNLANGLNGADIDLPEWMLSKMMRSARIKFSDYTILRLIQILGKYGNWRRVLQVIDWLESHERYKSNRLRYVYTTALDILGKAKRPVEAFNVFSAMLQKMSSYPDLVAYHSIAVTLGQAGHMKELFDVIDIMRSPPKKKFKTGALEKWDPRVEPDIVVYNAVLNACVKRKQWEGAFWVLQQFKEHGQQPTAATYGLIMEVMFACGKYSLVHDFFSKLKKSFIPNALAYKVVVNTLWKEGKIDEAVLTVQEMENRGIVGSASVYYDLARCLCSAGRFQEAVTKVDKICRVASKPLVVTYTGLLQACVDSGHIQDAVFIFYHMRQFCSPNLVTCNILLKGLLEHDMFEEAKELFSRMVENENENGAAHNICVLPDIYTFNTLLDACLRECRWDDFEFFYESMLTHGYNFNAKRHLRMILDASRAGKETPLELTWKSLIRAKRVPPPALLKQRFCSLVEGGDLCSALDFVGLDLTEELSSFSKKAWLNLLQETSHRFSTVTVMRLINEGNSLSRRIVPNLTLQNLMASCKEFLQTCEGTKPVDKLC